MVASASAPPRLDANADGSMSVTFGVSLTMTGMETLLLDHARVALEELVVLPHPVAGAFAGHLRAGDVELEHVGAGLLRPRGELDSSPRRCSP